MISGGYDAGTDVHLLLRPLPDAEEALARLTEKARQDLALLAHPAADWVRPIADAAGRDVRDVIIVGAGQAGLIVGLALKRDGVRNVALLDLNPAGYEGPWDTFARMAVLRTPKALVGAELGIPSLSARAWFEAVYGAEAWETITWIPRRDWMRYLRWYRTIAELDICNEVEVTGIAPEGKLLSVKTSNGVMLARRVVICTGHDGGGKWAVPNMVSDALPPDVYAHSNGPIDFAAMTGMRVGILGHGGSLRWKRARLRSIFAFAAKSCPWLTRTAGSNGPPFLRIIASSTIARDGMSGGISISRTSRRRATPLIAPAPNRACAFTEIAPGGALRGPDRQ